ncbi:hypothetical protein K3495_g5701 [Podosphaera aphanis]|nr:hypothetical protein K3495_g5701 [Podosphaera aphanis]
MLNLPLEILFIICDQLEYQRDFQTLFACARTGKLLLKGALQRLYRIHPESVVFGCVDGKKEDFGTPGCTSYCFSTPGSFVRYDTFSRKRFFLQRQRLWKSIIFSSFGLTAYPYCLYIRSLNLNLRDFRISALHCGNHCPDTLFASEMRKSVVFKHSCNPALGIDYIDFLKTSELIDESLLSYISEAAKKSGTTAHLENLTWYADGGTLTKWISHLPKLKYLRIQSQCSSNLRDLAISISDNCPHFQNLTVTVNPYTEQEREDEMLAEFLRGLKRNTLQKFITVIDDNFSDPSFGIKALLSLNHHGESLRCLKLCHLSPATIEKLHLLHACKGLTSLQFSLSHFEELKKTNKHLFQVTVDWICSCRNLRELSVGDSLDGTAILTHVCSKAWIRLYKLEITGIKFDESEDFFRALQSHTTLEHLRLGGNIQFYRRVAEKHLLSTIPRLRNLKSLDISTCYGSSSLGGGYDMRAIISLTPNLTKLQEFTLSCKNATNQLWPAMTSLRHLRILNINGVSSFTCRGMLAYIQSLSDTNHGLQLRIMAKGHERSNNWGLEVPIIRRAIRDRVGGQFEMDYYVFSYQSYMLVNNRTPYLE